MPTYAYACTDCDHRFETVQSFSDPSLTDCPECQGRLRKLFNSVGVVFKGSGFYRNDSRSTSSGASSSGKESTSSSSGSSTDSSSSDSSSSTSKSSSSSSSTSSSGTSSTSSSSSGSN